MKGDGSDRHHINDEHQSCGLIDSEYYPCFLVIDSECAFGLLELTISITLSYSPKIIDAAPVGICAESFVLTQRTTPVPLREDLTFRAILNDILEFALAASPG